MSGGRDIPNAVGIELGTLPELALCASSDYPSSSFTATQSPKSFPLSSLNHSRKPPNMSKGCRLLLYRQISGGLGDRDLQWVPELGQSCETEHRAYGICVHSRESELEPS